MSIGTGWRVALGKQGAWYCGDDGEPREVIKQGSRSLLLKIHSLNPISKVLFAR